jgi:NADH:ubiquinone oxidoreductase subunit K
MQQIEPYLAVSAMLFSIGLAIVITKRNAIVVLMGIELMLNAANLNLVSFSQFDKNGAGAFLSLFVIVVAAAESAVALAIILKIYEYYKQIDLSETKELKN